MKRELVDKKYTWNLTDILENDIAFEEAYKKANSIIDFSKYKGKLNNKQMLLELFKKQNEVSQVIERVYLYAMLNHDADTRNPKYDGMKQKAMSLLVKYNTESAFITPELVSLDESVIKSYINDSDFSDYDYNLKCTLKNKEHILSEECESLLALGGNVYSQFKDIFSKIDNADIKFKKITHNGKKYELTHGLYSVLMQNEDRSLRKKAFKEYYKAYMGLINTITSAYYGNVKKNVFLAKARNYKSALDKALCNEDVSVEVYNTLVKNVHKGLPLLHKYIEYKKNALNLETMHMYDMYVPTVSGAEISVEYEEAIELVKAGLKPLGQEYIELLDQAFNNGWIDVMETDGKRSGAYSTAIYGVHPYVLLNYQKTTHNVFTIAHELGHSLHSYYSNKNQPYEKSDYTIFVAEVASTVNEVLLLKHIVNTTTDKNVKKYLLTYLLEMMRTTLFRQTQFAEFESIAHSTVEKGLPLTTEFLNKEYKKLNKKYYGKSVVSDKEIAYEWSRIPHFYSAFYVYKYATGIISALSISQAILNEGDSAVERYKKFLSSGGSDSPTELLKIAGVDLTTNQPFESAIQVFEDTLKELQNI